MGPRRAAERHGGGGGGAGEEGRRHGGGVLDRGSRRFREGNGWSGGWGKGTKGMADQQMGGFDADVAAEVVASSSISGATPAGGRFANLGVEYLFIFYE